MAKLKVYGGLVIVGGKQRRAVVATTSQKRAAFLFEVSLYEFNNYFCETVNEAELEVALAKPEVVFYNSGSHTDREYRELEDACS